MFKKGKIIFLLFALILIIFCFQQCNTGPAKPRILVLNKAEFYFHESTPAGLNALERYCNENGIEMDVTDESESFSDSKLRKYIAVVFLNTAGDIFNYEQEKAFENYIHAGGGFLGIHTAIDTEHGWEWYGNLVGAQFESQSLVQKATLVVEEKNNSITSFLDSAFVLKDEWFNLKNISPNIHVLLNLDENSYTGGSMGSFHPVSWFQEFEGGRSFVTAMGHTKELYADSFFIKHLYEGLTYVMGEKKLPDYDKMYTKEVLDEKSNESGFIKKDFICDLYEPMGMDMFPDGKIIFIERRGAIKLFNPLTGETNQVDKFDLFTKQEQGLLGFAIDPKWEENHWIYFYYSPENDKGILRLSRFIFLNNKLDRSSEKILLKVHPIIGPDLFHAAGSLEFDAEGFLYIATGDNSSHRDGFSEIDERSGQQAYDAQKSSSNSMDLRGKILRIKPLADGSYLCPAGNLYTNQDVILPSFSDRNNNDPEYLKKLRGSFNSIALGKYNPEFGENKTPGNIDINNSKFLKTDSVFSSFGRPEIFVMGVRNPFRISFDDRRHTLYWGDVGPDAPSFDSLRGSEGFDEINAAKTAGFYGWPYFIGPNKGYREYDYQTNVSGNYYDRLHPINNSPNNKGTKFLPPAQPALIWYPFSTSKEFPLVANGTRCSMVGPTYYSDMYPSETRFPERYNGNLIIYDWMRNWMMAVKLDSMGNYISMEPILDNLSLARPIDMFFDKNGSLWMLEYGMEWYSKNSDACLSRIDFVKDKKQADTRINNTPIAAISWNFFNRNRSFYKPGDKLPYRLEYSDPEIERLVSQKINILYSETNQKDIQTVERNYPTAQIQTKFLKGQILIDKSDCKSCHALDRKINGPSYMDIYNRYANNSSANTFLSQKILQGGTGNWGDRVMVAHPQLTNEEANEIVKWIMALGNNSKERIYKEGRYHFAIPEGSKKKDGIFIFNAQVNNSPGEVIIFRSELQQVEKADSNSGVLRTYKKVIDGVSVSMHEFNNDGLILFKKIDLTGIKSIDFGVEATLQQNQIGGRIELRIDGINGILLGSVTVPLSESLNADKLSMVIDNLKLPKEGRFHNLFFIIKNEKAGQKGILGIDWLKFNLNR